ncbi:MAG: hypothetical protein GQ573_01475 [Gammaproteobacteria bacterium]|nr:hypothetical protein [Gammaproteobacteria bacterium]
MTVALILKVSAVFAADTQALNNPALNEQALTIKLEQYQQRLELLESRIADRQRVAESVNRRITGNATNPAISVILDGLYASYKNDPEDYALPGYGLGGEAGLAAAGFSLGHSEIIMSSNIDDKFFGQFTLVIAEHEGEVEVELEEAFFETLALGNGFTVRGGRFFSAIGYLNQQHEHVWDFQDAPLVYRGFFGKQYFDDGLRLSFVAPSDLFIELGAEAFSGSKYPAGGEHNNIGSWTAFVNFGGDMGLSHSWQAGLSYWAADNIEREYSSHEDVAVVETPLFEGDSKIIGVNAIYKWAPGGNNLEQNFKLQFEYFSRDEEGDMTLLNSIPLETSSLNSKQDGWYVQGIWQFDRNWRTGIRYDMLDSDNRGSDVGVLDEVGLVTNGHTPKRSSIMTEWLPSAFSRIRLQYNRDESYQITDNQIFLQYTFSIGAHGAHAF